MGTVMALTRDEERAGISAPPLNADESSAILTVAVPPVVVETAGNSRLETKIMCVLACYYHVFVIMRVVFRFFNHAPQCGEVIRVPIMALNSRGYQVCPKSPIYIFKQIRRYFMYLSQMVGELLTVVRHLDSVSAVNTE